MLQNVRNTKSNCHGNSFSLQQLLAGGFCLHSVKGLPLRELEGPLPVTKRVDTACPAVCCHLRLLCLDTSAACLITLCTALPVPLPRELASWPWLNSLTATIQGSCQQLSSSSSSCCMLTIAASSSARKAAIVASFLDRTVCSLACTASSCNACCARRSFTCQHQQQKGSYTSCRGALMAKGAVAIQHWPSVQ